jgi:hypothetical protein
VKHGIAADHREFESVGLRKIAFDDLDREPFQIAAVARWPHENPDIVTARGQPPGNGGPDKPGCSGHKRAHFSNP